MGKQTINVGEFPDDGTGDVERDAFIAANENFDELYAHAADTGNPHATTAKQVGAYSKAETDTLISDFVTRITAGVISPAQLATALAGTVVSVSNTSITLVEGETRTLVLTAATRGNFIPGTFGVLTRASTTADYAVIRPSAYNGVSGVLTFTILKVAGASGPFIDWQVANLAGSTLAQLSLLDDGKAAVTDARTARDSARKWATQVDAEVAPGLGYGAKKYAQDAGASATAAAASATAASGAADRAMTWDPTNYDTRAQSEAKFAALRGNVSASYNDLGKLEAGVTANATATSNNANAIAANTTAITATAVDSARALRTARFINASTFP